jgi:hypothetical protein
MHPNTRIGKNKPDLKHLIKIEYKRKIRPFSAIYGENNSGKTAFVESIKYLQYLMTENSMGSKLSKLSQNRFSNCDPTTFSITFYINGRIYRYTLHLNKYEVFYEKLEHLKHKAEAISIFIRDGDNSSVSKSIFTTKEDARTHIRVCPKDDLFIHYLNTINFKIKNKALLDVYLWFSKKLTIICKNDQYCIDLSRDGDCIDELNQVIGKLDIGVQALKLQATEWSRVKAEIADAEYNYIMRYLGSLDSGYKGRLLYRSHITNRVYVIKIYNGQSACYELMSTHNHNGNDIYLSFEYESKGTGRIVELIAFLMKLKHNPYSLFIKDDVDTSIHSDVLKTLYERYISSILEEKTRSQMVFTLHDQSLIGSKYFRNDALWLIDINDDQSVELVCADDYQLRSDKPLISYYQDGSLGGKPIIYAII